MKTSACILFFFVLVNHPIQNLKTSICRNYAQMYMKAPTIAKAKEIFEQSFSDLMKLFKLNAFDVDAIYKKFH